MTMRKCPYNKTRKRATIYNGHSYIERRIYVDDDFHEYVCINGEYFSLWDLPYYWDIQVFPDD